MPGHLRMVTVVVCTMLALAAGGEPLPASSQAPRARERRLADEQLLDDVAAGLGPRAGEAFRALAARELPGLREELRPAVATLPLNTHGRLGPTAVRYALHHLFLRRRGWLVKGLDPQGKAWASASPSSAVLLAGLPRSVRASLERGLAGPGLGLDGVATLAALLEHTVWEAEHARLRGVFDMFGIPRAGLIREGAAQHAAELFATSYVLGQPLSATNRTELADNLESMSEIYPNWPNVRTKLRETLEGEIREGSVDFAGMERVARRMVDNFWLWQAPACLSMKQGLMDMEDRGTGRVRLADFYGKALHEGKWQLSESMPYLRQLGALDESNPQNPRVVIPNYVYGASNCLATSAYLSVCCVSECEGLLGRLERGLGAPEAPAAAVAALVAALPSSTVPGNRSLSAVMRHRLNRIEAEHGGKVPLHGRLFAQWMHHAYPRECPYPHLAGRTRPLQAEDWMRVTGQAVSASPGAMAEHAGLRPLAASKKRGPLETAAWSYEEEIFVPTAAEEPEFLMMLHGTVYIAALAVVAFGFVLVKMARAGRKGEQAEKRRSQKRAPDPKMYEV